MRSFYYLLGMVLSSFLLAPASAQEGGHGDLTLIVRDAQGQPLPGITLALVYDGDLAPEPRGMLITDASGTITLAPTRWGTYRVTFLGTTPDGRAILPPERQNLGRLQDGSGQPGGFGVRFAERTATVLFVLATVPGEAAAVPMFDLAPDARTPPQPIDPLLAQLTPLPPSPSVAEAAPPATPGSLILLGLVIWVLAVLVLVGWWRTHTLLQRGEIHHGRLD